MSKSDQGMTGTGRAVVGIVILALVGGGVYLLRDQLFPKKTGSVAKIEPGELPPGEADIEAKDTAGITTVQEYEYVPAQKLPPVQGVKGYKWSETEKIVEFPINVWIGWLPIIAANQGAAPNANSLFYKKFGFKVRLKLIDNPVDARTAFANGDSHVLWGTLDMMALFAPGLLKDSRTAPRIYQLIDWSAGGDGIVAREGIKEVRDLKGKTVVFAQNSPSQYYLYNLLIRSGLQPGDIKAKYTGDAFQAARAFAADKSIDACVSWAPDIYNLSEKLPGARLLSSTADANRVIADVYAVRADFARDHPEVVNGLVEGIFLGMSWIKQSEENKKKAIQWLADFYKFPADEVAGMTADAYMTTFGDNLQFFLNKNNPTNFENSWNSISYVYKAVGVIDEKVPFDKVMDFSVIKKLRDEGKLQDQRGVGTTAFAPRTYEQVAEAKEPILRQALRSHVAPNSANLYEPKRDEAGKPVANSLYDPNVKQLLQSAAQLAGQFEAATIAVTGHCDASMRGLVDYKLAQQLSEKRAQAVRQALIEKYKFDPNKFVVRGKAWDEAANPADPDNHALNRRVEIVVYPPEAPE